MMKENGNRVLGYAFPVAFFVLAFTPLITLPFLDNEIEWREKRRPHPFPIPTETNWSDWPKAFEAFFTDRFGLRQELTELGVQLGFTRRASHQAVLEGKAGWFFYSPDGLDDTLAIASGRIQFSIAERAEIERRLLLWREWLASQGARLYLLIAPNKASVYPQFRPEALQVDFRETRSRRLAASLQAAGLRLVFPLEALRGGVGANDRIYYQHDTHWTPLGGFLAVTELLQEVKQDFDGIKTLDTEGIDVQETERQGGDLLAMRGGTLEKPDLDARPLRRAGDWSCPNIDWSNASGSVNRALNPSGENLTALVFHDSFMFHAGTYLAEAFGKTVFVFDWQIDPQLVLAEKPQIVIFELAERNLHQLLRLTLPPRT